MLSTCAAAAAAEQITGARACRRSRLQQPVAGSSLTSAAELQTCKAAAAAPPPQCCRFKATFAELLQCRQRRGAGQMCQAHDVQVLLPWRRAGQTAQRCRLRRVPRPDVLCLAVEVVLGQLFQLFEELGRRRESNLCEPGPPLQWEKA